MDGSGVFRTLPLLAFRLILMFLSLEDQKNMRHLSRWFEEKVTVAIPSTFRTFNIKLYPTNLSNIKRILTHSMSKHCGPFKLNISLFSFHDYNDSKLRKLLFTYSGNIISLYMEINDRVEQVFLDPKLKFDCLEKFSIKLRKCNQVEDVRLKLGIEAILAKHGNQLKVLSIWGKIGDLSVPALPLLDNLTLDWVDTDTALPILRQCNPTIPRLKLWCCEESNEIEHFNNYNDDIDLGLYTRFENLKYITVNGEIGINFVRHNPNNIVSLTIDHILCRDIPLKWPVFLKLRELSIWGKEFIPMLTSCKETLECLVYKDSNTSLDGDTTVLQRNGLVFPSKAIVLPRLTDLYVYGPLSIIKARYCKNFIRNNHKSLEFLFISCDEPVINFDFENEVVMEKLKTLVIITANCSNYTQQYQERLSNLCLPNAKIIILDSKNIIECIKLLKSRCQKKNFTIDVGNDIKLMKQRKINSPYYLEQW